MNENHLYVAGTTWSRGSDGEYTELVKYSLNGAEIALESAAKVVGIVNDQFSLDEKDGNLRIATTSYDGNKNINNLFVLDEHLEEIGRVTGFAEDEHIKAVRYIGDTAYVITYVQTDPLFVIDLSNPAKPVITGEVKIDGFSSSLTPVDENTLLGIGYGTYTYEYEGEEFTTAGGVKLALFDISDNSNPQVLDEFTVADSYSAAQETHKAIVHNTDKEYYAIPLIVEDYNYYYYNRQDNPYASGALVIRVQDGKISADNLKADVSAERCTYIDDYLYVLSDDTTDIYSFEVQ